MYRKAIRPASALIILLILLVNIITVYADQEKNTASKQEPAALIGTNMISVPEISAPSAILIECDRGQVLYQKQPIQRLHISAANKIMTALLAVLEKGQDLNANVTISKESVETEGSALNLEAGEKYSVEDLLAAVMLISANDAAISLAEYVGGDIAKFVTLMNSRANELNLRDTHFTNPTGLFDENQYTTAYDIALLTKYAVTLPAFNRLFSYQTKPWFAKDGSVKILTSSNKLFWGYEGVDGGKTGYNNKDQQTVIATATRGNRRLICVVLDAPEKTVFEDSIKLFDFGFENFRKSVLVPKGYPQKTVAAGDREINLISTTDVYYTHPVGDNYIKSLDFNITQELVLPIVKDRVLGTAKYVLNDNTVIEINLYSDTEVPLPESFYTSAVKKIKENRDIFLLLAFLAAIEVLLILYNIIKLIARLFTKLIKHSRGA